MRTDGAIPQDTKAPQCVASRERAAQVLRNKARHMHEEAVRLEQLADWAVGLNDAQDEALWNLVIASR